MALRGKSDVYEGVKIVREEVGEVVVVTPCIASLDENTAPAFTRALLASLVPGERVLLDLSEVEYANSSAIAALLRLAKHLRNRAGGGLMLCRLRTPVRAVVMLMQIHRVIDVFNSRQDGLFAWALLGGRGVG